MKRQQRMQDGERPVSDAERRLGLRQRPKQTPFMDDRAGGTRFIREVSRVRLARHHGERQRSPPKGRRWM